MSKNEINPFDAPFTREEQLAYCAVCLNRKKDAAGNYICGLTDDFADFKHACEYFVIDVGEKARFVREIEKSIDRRVQETTWVDKNVLGTAYFERIKENPSYVNNKISKRPSIELYSAKVLQYFVFVVITLVTSISFLGRFIGDAEESFQLERNELTFFSAATVIWALSAYAAFIGKRTVIHISNQGIILNWEKVLRWNTVENVCWKIKHTRGGLHYTMIVYLFNGLEIEYDVSSFDIDTIEQYVKPGLCIRV